MSHIRAEGSRSVYQSGNVSAGAQAGRMDPTYTVLLTDLLLDEIRHQSSRDFASFLSREEVLERHTAQHILEFHVASTPGLAYTLVNRPRQAAYLATMSGSLNLSKRSRKEMASMTFLRRECRAPSEISSWSQAVLASP